MSGTSIRVYSFGFFDLSPVDTFVGHDDGSLDSAGHHEEDEEKGSKHEEEDESSTNKTGGHPAFDVSVDDGSEGDIDSGFYSGGNARVNRGNNCGGFSNC